MKYYILLILLAFPQIQTFAQEPTVVAKLPGDGATQSSPVHSKKVIYGTFPEGQPEKHEELVTYLQGLLNRVFQKDKEHLSNLEITVLNTDNFHCEIHLGTKKLRRGNKVKKVYNFHLVLSKNSLSIITPNENVLVAILSHEWTHAQQFIARAGLISAEESQALELDADATGITAPAKVGYDPRPFLSFLNSNAKIIELLSYKGSIAEAFLTTHPNLELRISKMQKAAHESMTSMDFPVTPIVKEIPTNIQSFLTHTTPADKPNTEDLGLEKSESEQIAQGIFRLIELNDVDLERELPLLDAQILKLKAIADKSKVENTYRVFEFISDIFLIRIESSGEELKETLKQIQEKHHLRMLPLAKNLFEKENRITGQIGFAYFLAKKGDFVSIGEGYRYQTDLRNYLTLFSDEQRFKQELSSRTESMGEFQFDDDHGFNGINLDIDYFLLSQCLSKGLQDYLKLESHIFPLLSRNAFKAYSAQAPLKSGNHKNLFLRITSKNLSNDEILDFFDFLDAYPFSLKFSRDPERFLDALFLSLLEKIDSIEKITSTLEDPRFNKFISSRRVFKSAVTKFQLHLWDLVNQTPMSQIDLLEHFAKIAKLNPNPETDKIFDRQLRQFFLSDQAPLKPDLILTIVEVYSPVDRSFYDQLLANHSNLFLKANLSVPEVDTLIKKKKRALKDWTALGNWLSNSSMPEGSTHRLIFLNSLGEFINASYSEWLMIYSLHQHNRWKDPFNESALRKALEKAQNQRSKLGDALTELHEIVGHLNKDDAETERLLDEYHELVDSIQEMDDQLEVIEGKKRDQLAFALERSKPSLDEATAIIDERDNWDRFVIRYALEKKDKYLYPRFLSPFYYYNLAHSERLQRQLWPILKESFDQNSPIHLQLINAWKKLASRGVTEFTDGIFVNEILPLLADLNDQNEALSALENALTSGLLYDFNARQEVWNRAWKLRIETGEIDPNDRSNYIKIFTDKIVRSIPEPNPKRSEIIENFSREVRSSPQESRMFERLKSESVQNAESFMIVRILNAMIDGLKEASASDKITFLRFLRQDQQEPSEVLNQLKRVNATFFPRDEFMKMLNSKIPSDEIKKETSIDSLGELIEHYGYQRIQRFWNALGDHEKAAITNPIMVGPTGMLSNDEGRRAFIEAMVPQETPIDRSELVDCFTDYISALHGAGQGYTESFVQGLIFFKVKPGTDRSLGFFLKQILEASGPLAVTLGQRLANLELFAEKDNAFLHDLKDRSAPPTRLESYQMMGYDLEESGEVSTSSSLPKDFILDPQELGSASIKVVFSAENQAYATYRSNVQRKIEIEATVLRDFVARRVAKDPSRYGFLVPIVENIYAKKKREASPGIEREAALYAEKFHKTIADRTDWLLSIPVPQQAWNSNTLVMNKINATRFADLDDELKKEISNAVLDVYLPEVLGDANGDRDWSYIDPDIHSGNLLIDHSAKTIHLFDKSHAIGIKHQNISGFLKLLASFLQDFSEEKSIQKLASILESITGTHIDQGTLTDVNEYLTSPERLSSVSERQVILDAFQVQMLLGRHNIYFDVQFQDWMNKIQNLYWLERHTNTNRLMTQLLEKIGLSYVDWGGKKKKKEK